MNEEQFFIDQAEGSFPNGAKYYLPDQKEVNP